MMDQDCVLFPLVPSKYNQDNGMQKFEVSTIISNEGPCACYNFLTLPLIGSVDSYGTFTADKTDPNTKFLIDFFGSKTSFEEFVSGVCSRGRNHPIIDAVTTKIIEENSSWKSHPTTGEHS